MTSADALLSLIPNLNASLSRALGWKGLASSDAKKFPSYSTCTYK